MQATSRLISIMIPCYNQAEYTEIAVESALNQDYENIEVIVSDDSTNNETELKTRRFKSNCRFFYYKNEKNVGRVANYRKLLFELAKGEWVLMLDGDDYFIDAGYISKAISVIKKNPSVVLVGAGIKILYTSTAEIISRELVNRDVIFDGVNVLQKHLALPNHQTDIYPRELACKLDFYRDPSMASDSESLFRLCLNGEVAYLSDLAAVWRIHERNTTYTLDIKKQVDELVFIDKVYKYSLQHISGAEAEKWKEYMYGLMTDHILNLPGLTTTNLVELYWKVKNKLTGERKKELFRTVTSTLVSAVKRRLRFIRLQMTS